MRYLLKKLPEEKKIQDFIKSMRSNRSQVEYTTKVIDISDRMIGHCVRIYPNPKEKNYFSDEFSHHADCILPNAKLAGYGYSDNDTFPLINHKNDPWVKKYQNLRENFKRDYKKGLPGYIHKDEQNRKIFYDANVAMLSRCISSFLLFKIPKYKAEKFERFWERKPNEYNRCSNNCSSVPFSAFLEADIFTQNLSPPHTPRRVYHFLRSGNTKHVFSIFEGFGFLGFNFSEKRIEVRTPRALIS